MTLRSLFLSTVAFAAVAAPAHADDTVRVVATFSILGDMVERVGGEHVDVATLVGRNGDAHVFQPTPADARAVGEADLLVVNGLDFEGWLDRLIDASGFEGARVVASAAVEPIAYHHEHGDDEHHHDDHADHAEHEEHDDHHDEHAEHDDHHHHGAFDPHAWQSLDAAVAYVSAIAAGLAEIAPGHAAEFERNRDEYVAEIEALDAEIRAMIDALPEDRRTVVTSHDAFQYFGRDYGLTFASPQGLSTEAEASAKDVAGIVERIRKENISALFVENTADSRLLERIAEETGVAIGGTLYPGALSDEGGPAATYLDMMRHNATMLSRALAP